MHGELCGRLHRLVEVPHLQLRHVVGLGLDQDVALDSANPLEVLQVAARLTAVGALQPGEEVGPVLLGVGDR